MGAQGTHLDGDTDLWDFSKYMANEATPGKECLQRRSGLAEP